MKLKELPLCRALLLCSLIAVLSGCAAGTYVTPTSGPTAKLRFVTNTDGYFSGANIHREGVCEGVEALGMVGAEGQWIREGHGQTSDLNMLGGKSGPDSKRIERVIPAGKPITLHVTMTGPVRSGGVGLEVSNCSMMLSFVPGAGRQYELSTDAIANKCSIALNELSAGPGGKVVRTPVADLKKENRERCGF